MMYQRLGDFENAQVSYRQVLQRDDLNVEAHNNLGVLYRDKGLLRRCHQTFSAGDRHQPWLRTRPQQSRRRLSRISGSSIRPPSQFHAALAIDPKNVESMVNLSTVEKESGRRDEAEGVAHARARSRSAQCRGSLQSRLARRRSWQPDPGARALSRLSPVRRRVHPTLVGEVRKRIDAARQIGLR